MHWITDYLGKKWASGGRGPDKFDCWGILMDIYKKQLGVDIESYPGVESCGFKETAKMFNNGMNGSKWVEINKPKDICAVGLSRNKRIHHVGVYADVDGGKIVHIQKGGGCAAQSIIQMKAQGWRTFRYFTYSGV